MEHGDAASAPSAQALTLLETVGLRLADVVVEAPLLLAADLARTPWKGHRDLPASFAAAPGELPVGVELAFDTEPTDIREFLRVTASRRVKAPGGTESLMPYLFPTRPFTAIEIAELDDRCVRPEGDGLVSGTALWGRWARALRGVWTKEPLGPERPPLGDPAGGDPPLITIGRGQYHHQPKVCLANLEVKQLSWDAAAAGAPDVSFGRYKGLVRLVNAVLRTKPRPDYLLLPELSVPRKWVSSLSNRLLRSRISLVAGVEYRHSAPNLVNNEAVLVLTDDRLGFDSAVRIWQQKGRPAPGEEEDLLRLHGREWNPGPGPDRVYRHRGFEFAVLLCSELQEIALRHRFQGQVDSLMVLSWNKDLETFVPLVEAAALDVHAYIALVNNRLYGDSRVRVPAKQAYQRDLCRIRGGLNDYAVVVQLDVESLRRFQSRAKNCPRANDEFKPVPQGFRIAARRRVTPGVSQASGPNNSG
jgi:hypothetical protein